MGFCDVELWGINELHQRLDWWLWPAAILAAILLFFAVLCGALALCLRGRCAALYCARSRREGSAKGPGLVDKPVKRSETVSGSRPETVVLSPSRRREAR